MPLRHAHLLSNARAQNTCLPACFPPNPAQYSLGRWAFAPQCPDAALFSPGSPQSGRSGGGSQARGAASSRGEHLHASEWKGNIIGFKGELIHMYNKNRTSVATPEYFHNVKEKTNIVLLGDSLGDLGMLGDVESQEVVLRIGFLNNKIEERLQQYMKSFDIVLIDDQTMDVVNGILRKIIY
ncbi:hypothetical protein ISCGN_001172 [Ixodes scapularis]